MTGTPRLSWTASAKLKIFLFNNKIISHQNIRQNISTFKWVYHLNFQSNFLKVRPINLHSHLLSMLNQWPVKVLYEGTGTRRESFFTKIQTKLKFACGCIGWWLYLIIMSTMSISTMLRNCLLSDTTFNWLLRGELFYYLKKVGDATAEL